ncbi:MAG: sel1 repeat family protein, partial [Elusimicrobiaceae bacterium]|nr:sel1 repeat family protein [Elusimicrobiaceae bacterium]
MKKITFLTIFVFVFAIIGFAEKTLEPTSAKAQYDLAEEYFSNCTPKKEYKENCEQAVYWYQQSSAQGNLNALSSLAYMYSNGLGVK